MERGVSPDADQPGREVVETTRVVGLEGITLGVSPVEDQPLGVAVSGFPVVDEGTVFGVSPWSHGVVFELSVVVFGFPDVDEGIGLGVSPWSHVVVVLVLAVAVLGLPIVDEGIGLGVSPWSHGEVVLGLSVVVLGFSSVDEDIGFGLSPWSHGVVVFELAVVVFGFPVVDEDTGVGVSEERGRGVSAMAIPVEVVDGFAFMVWVVAIGLCVSSMGVPGAGVVEDPIGFGVSSVEDGLLGVKVSGFSDVDGDIGCGVSSTILVVV